MYICIHVHFYVVHVRSYILNCSLLFLTLTLCENVWKGNVIQVSSFRAQQIVYMQMKNCMSASHVNKAQVTASLQYGSWKFSGGKRSGPVLALARPYHRADLYSNILCHYKWQSCQHDASIISTFSIITCGGNLLCSTILYSKVLILLMKFLDHVGGESKVLISQYH